jgi:DNA polymerase III delta subunit
MTAKPTPPVTLLWGEDDYILREAALALLGETRSQRLMRAQWEGRLSLEAARPRLFSR